MKLTACCGLRAYRYFVCASVLLAGAAFAEDSPETLIHRLADEDPAVRDGAEAALEARGTAVLEDLDRFGSTCGWADAEGNARLRMVAARIRDEVAWAAGAKSAKAMLEAGQCGHGDHGAKAEVVPMRDVIFRRAFPSDRIFAVRGTCCEAAAGWALVVVDREGKARAFTLKAADPLFERIAPVTDVSDAGDLVAAMEAARKDPLHFEEGLARFRELTVTREVEGSSIEVTCGEIVKQVQWTFDKKGSVSDVRFQGW